MSSWCGLPPSSPFSAPPVIRKTSRITSTPRRTLLSSCSSRLVPISVPNRLRSIPFRFNYFHAIPKKQRKGVRYPPCQHLSPFHPSPLVSHTYPNLHPHHLSFHIHPGIAHGAPITLLQTPQSRFGIPTSRQSRTTVASSRGGANSASRLSLVVHTPLCVTVPRLQEHDHE